MNHRVSAVAAVAVLLVSALGPGSVAAVASAGNSAGNAPLTVSVSQTSDDVEIDVARNDTGVANATVNVTVANGSYDGAGTYTTDSDGVVSLPTPDGSVTVELTASKDDDTVVETASLTPAEDRYANFGQRVSAYVHELIEENGPGAAGGVSSFVTDTNPGNAPDHAGPNDDERDSEADANETRTDDDEADETDETRTDDEADETDDASDDSEGDESDDVSTSDDDQDRDGEAPGNGNGNGPGNGNGNSPGNGPGNSNGPGNGKAKGR